MAYNALNNLIDAYIYANGVQAITGQILNGVLKQMVSQLGSGYHLMGVAGPETVPEQNDFAMAYFAATAGEYTDFGGITLAAGEVAVLLTYGNGSWEKKTIYTVPTTTEDLENTAGFITNAVTDLVNYYTKTEVDDALANYPTLEALATALADYYTKQEVDTTLADYATKDVVDETLEDYYTKDEMDAALADRYTKDETDTKLGDYYKKTETYDKDEVDSIVAALSRQEYIVAWDGLAAPDVSAIPAGVTVTYNATPYTGTLAASASTVNKIYMVWNGVAYDMYGTSQDGGYSWVPMGTTSVDLSQYATKAELGQLQQKVTGNVVKNLSWSGGYVQAVTGLIKSSTLSKFSQPILLKAGETITVGTQNSNIGIICSTSADSVAVGDTVTIIKQTSSSGQFETFDYTATEDIKVVVCVLVSNYTLSFYDADNLDAITDDLVKRVSDNEYSLDNKVNSASLNLVNAEECLLDKALNWSGSPSTANGFAITNFIPVNGKDVIIRSAYSSENTWTSGCVYDKNKNLLRTLGTTNQYSYVSGDYYVRFTVYKSYLQTYPELSQCNYGTTLLPYTKYNPVRQYLVDDETAITKNTSSIEELYEKTNGLEEEFSGKVVRAISGEAQKTFSVKIPVGDVLLKVSTDGNAYCDLSLYDASDNVVYSGSSIYTTSSTPFTHTITTSAIVTKIVVETRSSVNYLFEFSTDNYGYEKVKDDVLLMKSELYQFGVPISPSLSGYNWVVGGKYSVGVIIGNNGTIERQSGKSSMVAVLSFLPKNVKSIDIDTKTYINSGYSSLMYAFYSDIFTQDETTFISGGGSTTGSSVSEVSFDEVAVPDNAVSLIVACAINGSVYDGVYNVTGKTDIIENIGINEDNIRDIRNRTTLWDINNGTPKIYKTIADLSGFSSNSYKNVYEDCFKFKVISGNSWIYTSNFNPIGERLVHIKFIVTYIDETNPVYVMVAKSSSSSGSNYTQVGQITTVGEYDITFDATYFRIYQGFSDNFCVWFYNYNMPVEVIVKNLIIYETEADELVTTNIGGANAKELFASVDENLSSIAGELYKPSFVVAPNGDRYELMVNNLGQLIAKTVIPNKAVFFGNSLMAGNSNGQGVSFGMSASDITKDFYAKFRSYVHDINPDFDMGWNKYSIVSFEQISDVANIDSVVATMVNNLTGDEDLVILQGGDNVSSQNAETVFPTSTVKLLKAIRNKCPNARVCWLAIWYNSAQKYKCVNDACRQCGCTIVPIADLNTVENQSTVGSLIDYGTGTPGQFVLGNVSSVVENSATNITVTFTYLGVQYTTTLDVVSYSLDGTDLTYTGRYQITTVGYSHPGDRGMAAIANRLLYYTGICDDDNAFPLDYSHN